MATFNPTIYSHELYYSTYYSAPWEEEAPPDTSVPTPQLEQPQPESLLYDKVVELCTPSHEDPIYLCLVRTCISRYKRKNDLKAHVLAKHRDIPGMDIRAKEISRPRISNEGKPFACQVPECPHGYSRKSDLERHIKKRHGTASAASQEVPSHPASTDQA